MYRAVTSHVLSIHALKMSALQRRRQVGFPPDDGALRLYHSRKGPCYGA